MRKAPRRPKYFSGQLITEEGLNAEQSYFLGGRRSDNRQLHGWGVVCGLGVTPSGSGGLVIEPGLAIDGLGREIVVPEQREMPDAHQPIDDRGEPCGEPVDSEVMTICLAYAELAENESDPAHFMRETYTIDVRPGPAGSLPRSRAGEAVLTGSSAEVAQTLCETAAADSCDPPEQCVPIATVGRRKGELNVELYPRRTVAATDVLVELILGLVQRVQVLEQRS